jgi:hypothetical protein
MKILIALLLASSSVCAASDWYYLVGSWSYTQHEANAPRSPVTLTDGTKLYRFSAGTVLTPVTGFGVDPNDVRLIVDGARVIYNPTLSEPFILEGEKANDFLAGKIVQSTNDARIQFFKVLDSHSDDRHLVFYDKDGGLKGIMFLRKQPNKSVDPTPEAAPRNPGGSAEG